MGARFELRVGIATEIGARVGVGPACLSEAIFSPTGIDPGTLVPFRGAKGSYVGYISDGLELEQEEISRVKSKTQEVRRDELEDVLRSIQGFYQTCTWNGQRAIYLHCTSFWRTSSLIRRASFPEHLAHIDVRDLIPRFLI